MSLSTLAGLTEDMSGSDLKELCRNAAMVPVREYMRLHFASGGVVGDLSKMELPVSSLFAFWC